MIKYSFKKYQPLGLRIWHWLNATVIFGLLGTVLLRKTFLSWRSNSVIIENKLKEAGTVISSDLAKEIAVSIRNPLWDWHIYLGFALGTLLVCRFLIAVFVERKCPGMHSLKSAIGLKNLPANEKAKGFHYVLVKTSYTFFYFISVMMVITGLILNFKDKSGISKETVGSIKEIHELSIWFFVVFAGCHILGIIIAENKGDSGLVSDMINGGDPKNQ